MDYEENDQNCNPKSSYFSVVILLELDNGRCSFLKSWSSHSMVVKVKIRNIYLFSIGRIKLNDNSSCRDPSYSSSIRSWIQVLSSTFNTRNSIKYEESSYKHKQRLFISSIRGISRCIYQSSNSHRNINQRSISVFNVHFIKLIRCLRQ